MINNEFQFDIPNTCRVPVHSFLRKPTSCCTRNKRNTLLKLVVATSSVFVVIIQHSEQHSLESFKYFISNVWWARFIDCKSAEIFLLVTKNTKLLWQVSLNGSYSTMLIIQHSIWGWQRLMQKKPARLQGLKKTTPTWQISQESQLPGWEVKTDLPKTGQEC